MIKLTSYNVYNEKRYGTPWAAKVYFASSKLNFDFCGFYSGEKGYSGDLYIDAKPGDVISWGQKDHRGNGGSIHYALINADLTVTEFPSKKEASEYLMTGGK